MDKTKAKFFLASLPEDVFIKWYNNDVVDPYGDFSFATIRENNAQSFKDILDILAPDVLVEMCSRSRTYDADHKWVIFTGDEIFSFNSVIDLLDTEYIGEGIIDAYLDNEDEYKPMLIESL